MKYIKILIVLLVFYSGNAFAVASMNFATMEEALAQCTSDMAEFDYIHNYQTRCEPWPDTPPEDVYWVHLCPASWAQWCGNQYGTQNITCPHPKEFDQASISCKCPVGTVEQGSSCVTPPPTTQECLDRNSDTAGISYDSGGAIPTCLNECSVDTGMGLCGSGTCYASATYDGTNCTVSNGSGETNAPPGCLTNANGDILCDGDIVDSYNGNELPGGDLPDNSCEYLADGSLVCDSPVGDTSGGTQVQELQDDGNPDYPQSVHNDYSSLPPGTGIDTNGDGTTDAITQDLNSDGISDNVINADGTDFLKTSDDGTVDTTPTDGTINDDGTPNYPEAQEGGEEDGFGEGTGECTDNPDTPEDECGDINKSGATTPYCDSEPTCEGDPLQCANIYQNWQILCAYAPAPFHTKNLETFEDGDDGSKFYNEATDNIDLSAFDFTASASGWGYTASCPADIPITNSFGTFAIPLSSYCGLLDLLGALVLIASTWISVMIFANGVRR